AGIDDENPDLPRLARERVHVTEGDDRLDLYGALQRVPISVTLTLIGEIGGDASPEYAPHDALSGDEGSLQAVLVFPAPVPEHQLVPLEHGTPRPLPESLRQVVKRVGDDLVGVCTRAYQARDFQNVFAVAREAPLLFFHLGVRSPSVLPGSIFPSGDIE